MECSCHRWHKKTDKGLLQMCLLLLAALLLAAAISNGEQQTSPIPFPVVQTKLGAITGRVLTASNGRQYEGFRGIPYAKPPVGELRFSKPQPLLAFQQGQLDASDFGKWCWQQGANVSTLSEDCLFVNVFRPLEMSSAGSIRENVRPVFVYIHGGAFLQGSSSMFDVGQLVTEGEIIVVTVNYRLGIFGFLSTGDSVLPGNYGLWDQHVAIRWVKDNIQAFGGGPDEITIGGESAGAISVSFQSLSSVSRGLFNRAILQSGAATSAGILQRNPLEKLLGLAQRVGCPVPDSSSSAVDISSKQDLATCLRAASPDKLLSADYPDRSLARAAIDIVYGPTVDGDFVAENPAGMLKQKENLTQIGFYDRDYLSGCVNNEGGLLYTQVQVLTGNVSLILNPELYDYDLVPMLIGERFGRSSPSAEEVVRFFYTFPRYPGSTQLDLKQVLDTTGDALFYVPLNDFARAIARGQSSERRNLVYLFEHYPTFVSRGDLGTPHGVDLLYEFDMYREFVANLSSWNADDKHLRQLFVSTIIGFVKTGNPATALQSYLQESWTNFDLRDESYLSISAKSLSLRHHLRSREVSLWTDLLPSLLEPVSQRKDTSTHVPTLSELIG